MAFMFLVFGSVAHAADLSALKDQIEQALTRDSGVEMKVTAIEETPASGLVKVTLENGPVLYATEDGDHFVVGDLWSLGGNGLVNLSEKSRSEDRKRLVDAISPEDMIVFPAKGERRAYITVFTDTTCFYCQKLHQEVSALNDNGIEVRYLAYPRAGLDSDGARQLETAWCSSDRRATLTALKSGETRPEKTCADAPIAEQYQLGVEMGVRGTPAIVTSDGELIPGYKPAADIALMLGL